MCIVVFRHFLFWKIVFPEYSAVMPFWVQKSIRVCTLVFFVVFYSEKFFWMRIGPLRHFGFRKKSENVHIGFSSFSILENCLSRVFGRYAILGSEKYSSMHIGVFCRFLFRKILLDEDWAATPFWV